MMPMGMNNARRRQAGQALVEALLLLPLMALVIWGAAWVGNLQFSAQQMSQLSRQVAMAGALGQASTPTKAGRELDSRLSALPGVAAPRMAVLQREWFGQSLQLLSVHARLPSAIGAGAHLPASALAITRHTHVAVGAGHAHGDADAARRIGQAPTAWRQAERNALMAARPVGGVARRMDGPWGRPALQLDWLTPWADVVPTERVDRRKGRTP